MIEFHRITKLLRLEGTFGDCSVQIPAQSTVNKNRLLMAVSSPVLNVSKDRDSKTFHGNLFQCSFTLTIKKIFFFLRLSGIFCISVCTFCHLFFCLHGSEESLALQPSYPPKQWAHIFLCLLCADNAPAGAFLATLYQTQVPKSFSFPHSILVPLKTSWGTPFTSCMLPCFFFNRNLMHTESYTSIRFCNFVWTVPLMQLLF